MVFFHICHCSKMLIRKSFALSRSGLVLFAHLLRPLSRGLLVRLSSISLNHRQSFVAGNGLYFGVAAIRFCQMLRGGVAPTMHDKSIQAGHDADGCAHFLYRSFSRAFADRLG